MIKQRHIEDDYLIITHYGGPHTYQDALEAREGLLLLNTDKKIYTRLL